jgi:hypothetical protein
MDRKRETLENKHSRRASKDSAKKEGCVPVKMRQTHKLWMSLAEVSQNSYLTLTKCISTEYLKGHSTGSNSKTAPNNTFYLLITTVYLGEYQRAACFIFSLTLNS